jgi:hypothetical protein
VRGEDDVDPYLGTCPDGIVEKGRALACLSILVDDVDDEGGVHSLDENWYASMVCMDSVMGPQMEGYWRGVVGDDALSEEIASYTRIAEAQH